LLVVFADGDPSLAAEPGFHDVTPGGVHMVAVPFGHTFDNLPELPKDLTTNPLPQSAAQSEPALRMVVKLAWRQSADASNPDHRLAFHAADHVEGSRDTSTLSFQKSKEEEFDTCTFTR
jgi:hypothetical protein